MKAIVGYTGFVGQNIDAKANFDLRFNSRNITEAYATKPDLLVYAGMSAEKYLANHEPEKDYAKVQEALENIRRIEPKKLVLISSADVYANPIEVDENAPIIADKIDPYGRNRYLLEQEVQRYCPDVLIVRLPALYGVGIKKNFIYDFIKRIPFMLTYAKYSELTAQDDFIVPFYVDQGNGFYKCHYESESERVALKNYFVKIGFSALQFTDSRSKFQFYPLNHLWNDIQVAMEKGLQLVNITTEPISAAEVYHFVTGKTFVNELNKVPANYDIHSIYTPLFGGHGHYMLDKEYVLEDMKQFILSYK